MTLAAALPELSSQTGFLDDLDLVGYNYKEHLYEADHVRFPDKPFIGSENSHRYADWLARSSGTTTSPGSSCGPASTTWARRAAGRSTAPGAGLLTLAGFEKETWHLRRSWWSDEPVARLAMRPQRCRRREDLPDASGLAAMGLTPTGSRSRCCASATATSCS